MTAHLSNEEINSYCERRLPRHDLDRVHEHLFSCETCYDQFLVVFKMKRRFPIEIDLNEIAGLAGWHLQGQELKDYVEGRLIEPDLTFANTHLKECAWCREEAHHISDFTDKLQYYLSKRHAPIEQPAVWRRHHSRLSALSWGSRELARAAAIVLLVLGSAIILWSMWRTKPEAKQASLSAPTQEDHPAPTGTSKPSRNATGTLSATQPNLSDRSNRAQGPLYADNNASRSSRSMDRGSEASLIAANLLMPKVIERFDRSRVILRGDDNRDESFNIISPYATVITDEQPTFRWSALSGAASYIVSVYDENLDLVEKSKPVTQTRWSATRPLKRGIIYTWIVTAIKDGKEILAPELPARAEFKIIEDSQLVKLNYQVNQVQSWAARGVLYARAGLLDKAEQEFLSHLAQYTADERVKTLLEITRSWREP